MSTRTILSAAEFARTGPETDDCELVRGEVVAMPPAKGRHGAVCMKVGFLLMNYLRHLGRGVVICNDSGLLTEKNPDTVRGVDVALFLNPTWPEGEVPDAYIEEPPTLAVEVRSTEQNWRELQTKTHEYLNMGVLMVWIIDPTVKRITVFRPDQGPEIFAAENELDGGEILPGFRCRVAEFFS